MGNTSNSEHTLQPGEGYRIVKVAQHSPFLGQVEEFFDFIIDIIPPKPERSVTDILDKLSIEAEIKVEKSPLQILQENLGKVISVKIVSTKYRNTRTIEVNLSSEAD
jgi:hypothetical protein